jgi:hypothetical protein
VKNSQQVWSKFAHVCDMLKLQHEFLQTFAMRPCPSTLGSCLVEMFTDAAKCNQLCCLILVVTKPWEKTEILDFDSNHSLIIDYLELIHRGQLVEILNESIFHVSIHGDQTLKSSSHRELI